MPRGKKRKTRVTKAEVRKFQEEQKKKVKGRKNKIIPGPWTMIKVDPKIKIVPKLRTNKIFYNNKESIGAYTKNDMWTEKSWYPIIINITSTNIAAVVKKYGLEQFLAAWEEKINTKVNEKKYGHIVLTKTTVDHSLNKDKTRRFISCHAKTNRKSIKGFTAMRKREFVLIGEENGVGSD